MTDPAVVPRRQGIVRILARQVLYQDLLLLRSPSGPFFTFAIPLMILVSLNLVYGDSQVGTRGGIGFPQFYVPSMVAFAVLNTCYVNMVNGTTIARQAGMLKRVRGTPLPGWAYLGGRVGAAATLAVPSVLVVLVAGTTLFEAQMVWSAIVGFTVTVAVGIGCCCLLGLAVSGFVASTEAALPVAYGTFLPVSFVSDVFFPVDTAPSWLRAVAGVFPIRPFAHALQSALTPGAPGPGLYGRDLAVLGAWTAGALVLIAWRFPWEPARPRAHVRRHH